VSRMPDNSFLRHRNSRRLWVPAFAWTTSRVWRRISSPLPVLTGRGRERSERVRGFSLSHALAPHPETSLRSVSDLSPQAGRGEASAPSAFRFHFQTATFKQPCVIALTPRASWGFSLAPQNARARPASFAPLKRGAWSAARRNVLVRFRHRLRGDVTSESASPHGAPFRRFWARGPYFRGRTGAEQP